VDGERSIGREVDKEMTDLSDAFRYWNDAFQKALSNKFADMERGMLQMEVKVRDLSELAETLRGRVEVLERSNNVSKV
jgi:hypothetical protein